MQSQLLYSIVFLGLLSSYYAATAPPTPIKLTGKVTESFDSMGNGPLGTILPFNQGTTIAGWWSNQDSLIVSDGSSNVGALYSFGELNGADRAIGAVTSNKKKSIIFGVSYTADQSISEITLSFVGEQWRYGGDVPDTSNLVFDYSIMTTSQYADPNGWGAVGDTALWTSLPDLSFQGNNTFNNTVGPVRYIQSFSATLKTANMGTGKVLQLRWTSHNGHDGLSIDNVVIAPVFVPDPDVPVPHKNLDLMKILVYVLGGLLAVSLISLTVVTIKWRRSVNSHNYAPVEAPVIIPPNANLSVYAQWAAHSLNNNNINNNNDDNISHNDYNTPNVPSLSTPLINSHNHNHNHNGNHPCDSCGRSYI